MEEWNLLWLLYYECPSSPLAGEILKHMVTLIHGRWRGLLLHEHPCCLSLSTRAVWAFYVWNIIINVCISKALFWKGL